VLKVRKSKIALIAFSGVLGVAGCNLSDGNYELASNGNSNASDESTASSSRENANSLFHFNELIKTEELINSFIGALAVQEDGRIVAVGVTDMGNDASHCAFARYLPSGHLDKSFGNGGIVYDSGSIPTNCPGMRIQPDGKIVAVGESRLRAFNQQAFLTRYNQDGSLDTSFGNGGRIFQSLPVGTGYTYFRASYIDVFVQANGKLLVIGDVAKIGFSTNTYQSRRFLIVRYEPNGELDRSFGTQGIVEITLADDSSSSPSVAGALLPNGKILLVAGSTGLNSSGGPAIPWTVARLNADGTLDSSFGNMGMVRENLSGGAFSIDVQDDGKFLIGGNKKGPGPGIGKVVRYLEDGTLDISFGLNGEVNFGSAARAVKVTDQGIVVSGTDWANRPSGYDGIVSQYSFSGELDTSFGQNGTLRYGQGTGHSIGISAIAIGSNDKVYIGGDDQSPSSYFNNSRNFAIGRVR
jgi:uncharacterized delta-60 repeat protein